VVVVGGTAVEGVVVGAELEVDELETVLDNDDVVGLPAADTLYSKTLSKVWSLTQILPDESKAIPVGVPKLVAVALRAPFGGPTVKLG